MFVDMVGIICLRVSVGIGSSQFGLYKNARTVIAIDNSDIVCLRCSRVCLVIMVFGSYALNNIAVFVIHFIVFRRDFAVLIVFDDTQKIWGAVGVMYGESQTVISKI